MVTHSYTVFKVHGPVERWIEYSPVPSRRAIILGPIFKPGFLFPVLEMVQRK
jgi:hypothetical protein